MEVSLAKRLILSVSMHGGRYFFIQPFLFFPDGRERGGTGWVSAAWAGEL